MAITDWLLNKDNLQRQRDRAIDFAEERYDPSVYSAQLDYARERATEGISEGQESIARQRTVESLFRPTDTSIYGGNQARAIAGEQQRNRQAQQGLADFESQLTRQDIQAQQQGRQQFAQTRTQQQQTAAQRDAAIEEAEMQYEAELENRRKQLGSAVANLAGTVAGSFLGPAGAAAGGAIAGSLVGGGSGAVQGAGAGFTTSFQREQSEDFINQLTGGEQQQQQSPDIGQLLTDAARMYTAPQRPQDQPVSANIGNVGMDLDLPQPIRTQQETGVEQTQDQQQFTNQDFGQYDLREFQQDVGFGGVQDVLGIERDQSQAAKQGITQQEINRALVGSELEMTRGSGVGRTLTDMFMGGLIGVDTEGTRYSTSVADILRSPFDVFAPAAGEFVGEQLRQQKQQAQERRQRVIEQLLRE